MSSPTVGGSPGENNSDSTGVIQGAIGISLVTLGLGLMTVDAGIISSGILATGTALTTGGWSKIRSAQKRLQEKMEAEVVVQKAISEAENARVAEAETRKKLSAAKSETEQRLSKALWQQYKLVAAAAFGLTISSYLWLRSRNIEQKHEVTEEKLNESESRLQELDS